MASIANETTAPAGVRRLLMPCERCKEKFTTLVSIPEAPGEHICVGCAVAAQAAVHDTLAAEHEQHIRDLRSAGHFR